MVLVPRQVIKQSTQELAEPSLPQDLADFRNTPAWVLLGEPGMGKSETLISEAKATGANAQYIGIDEFIADEPDEQWRGKTLFLDGLDEVRGSDNIVQRIRAQLRKLNNPPFRISCRAADWLGTSDQTILEKASPDSKLQVLFLEPLSHENIVDILRENHGIQDPQAFVDHATRQRLDHLLGNPQTLGLLADSIQNNQWPTSRSETYRLACQQLAQEVNKKHRDKQRSNPIQPHKILGAAGQLCAVLLLSGKTGIALDRERANERFPELSEYAPPDTNSAMQALHSRLFRSVGEAERLIPAHRSIAEYLAARWLADQLDQHALPLGRVLNLLLGHDGRTIAGLRGLYAWLAFHSVTARARLLDADPFTTIVYGDPKPMSVSDKRDLLAALKREAQRFVGFRWGTQAMQSFGALTDPELSNDFANILQTPERDDASQAHVDCILDILCFGDPIPTLAPLALNIVKDDTYHFDVRHTALETWLKLSSDIPAAIQLLNDLKYRLLTDPDDRFSQMLLRRLYPQHLPPEVLLQYLHAQERRGLVIEHNWFWTYDLPRLAPDEHLPILLDGLASHPHLAELGAHAFGFRNAISKLLTRGLLAHGDHISAERLFVWLGIGADKYGNTYFDNESQNEIAAWLSARPERYKALLAICYAQCETHENPGYCIHTKTHRLQHAQVPDDLGLWHLSRALPENGAGIAHIHLEKAAKTLADQRGAIGLTLDLLITWGNDHPVQRDWLDTLLACEIPNWLTEEAERKIQHEKERTDFKLKNTQWLWKQIDAIRAGTAHASVMHQLAGVWAHRFINVSGDTPAERFNSYCENGDEAMRAAESGFRRCLERTDLPSVDEIIDLSTKSREHYIRLPCLIGMDLLWQDNPDAVEQMSDEVSGRMIAFYLTDGTRDASGWFKHLAQRRAELFSDVLVTYAHKSLKARHGHITGIYPLAHDPEYQQAAVLAAPKLLEVFPVRARSTQLNNLEYLLKVALRSVPEQMLPLVRRKLSLKGMDAAQKVYWHVAATLLKPNSQEAKLWKYIGKSPARINHLANFLGERGSLLDEGYEFSAQFIGKLIQTLAPHAQTDRPHHSGAYTVTNAMRRGDLVRTLIATLGTLANDEAAKELERLITLPALGKVKRSLETARHELAQRRRELDFTFLPISKVVQVIANLRPANVADLAALVLAHLKDMEQEIRHDNDDGYRAFWNVKDKKPIDQRDEEDCRDALLTRLRPRLKAIGVDAQPEGDYARNKRADLRLSYQADFELPIEIKKDSHAELWTALRKQLIRQYAIAPRAYGTGIYLVLWFGGQNMKGAKDGGKKPTSPAELQTRLTALLSPAEHHRVFVRVLDVSWPK